MGNEIVKIIKEQDDPICSRISMGGKAGIGYYVVYRGDLDEVKKIIDICRAQLEKLIEKDGELHEKKNV